MVEREYQQYIYSNEEDYVQHKKEMKKQGWIAIGSNKKYLTSVEDIRDIQVKYPNLHNITVYVYPQFGYTKSGVPFWYEDLYYVCVATYYKYYTVTANRTI